MAGLPHGDTVTYCTILSGRTGAVHRYYQTKESARRAAQRHCRAHGTSVEVAWCKAGVPKAWVAYVTPNETRLTEYWNPTTKESSL